MTGLLADAITAFLRLGEVSNHTPATLRTYAADLGQFVQISGVVHVTDVTSDLLERYLVQLRARMKPISVHRHYRLLRTFTRWLVRTGRLQTDPMSNFTMRLPKTLPSVPEDDDVRRLLEACSDTFEGRRNRALIGLAADSGIRKEEMRHLRVGDLDLARRLVYVRGGKGQKDGVTFFGDATASIMKTWLTKHPAPHPASPLFCKRDGRVLGRYGIVRILHRLSRRARLSRKIGPHALRHYAATALLRRTGDLELVRQVLRHQSLTMALRYVVLAQADVAAKYQHASPLDHLKRPVAGRGLIAPQVSTRG